MINDTNTLNKKFYHELLHIIGLVEYKKKGKKLIYRKPEGKRDKASIIENTMIQLDVLDKINRLKEPEQYGKTKAERLFNVALELTITWINRILFLKLLEAKLISYNKGDKAYAFLNKDKLSDFDDLNKLFFRVLARKPTERSTDVNEVFEHIPYLNSSLFEPTDLEHDTICISGLENNKKLPVHPQTVLQDSQGNKQTGVLGMLEYLFDFLDAYDFSSEGSEEIQEDNKTLINASVLGLIFEKINGYKDGSFFTPSFITMYMCKETIRKAVVQKFNDVKGWACTSFDELYNKIEDKKEANQIISTIRICDPAVGSGHFLVSALNEVIAIKSELKILLDRNGRNLRDYNVEVVNDELMVIDDQGKFFEYNPKSKESQRVQETLFHEKHQIIEHCLFGVDININSVKICRLRLWIELLKNAYYRSDNELETLPNIDINIKHGNSLISRFDLDISLEEVLKSSNYTIKNYQEAVYQYRNTDDKDQKRAMQKLIEGIKSDFKAELHKKDKNKELETQINQYEHIYQNAFEWRIEFPEVLNENGDFVGFDVVIGNPPYIRQEEFKDLKFYLKEHFKIYHSIADLLTYFVEKSYNILRFKGIFQFIISNKFTRANYGKVMRSFLLKNTNLTHYIDFSGLPVFDEATVDAAILGFKKSKIENAQFIYIDIDKNKLDINNFNKYIKEGQENFKQNNLSQNIWAFEPPEVIKIKEKIETQGISLEKWKIAISRGILTGYNEAFIINENKKEELIAEDPKSKEVLKPILRGRDINKYYPDFKRLWLIYIPWHFPLHENNNKENLLSNAENEFQKQYPAIYKHLLQKKEKLSNRNKAETGIRYEWYALQRFGSKYWQDFEKPKIIYPNMTKFFPFLYDNEKFYTNQKCFILTGESLKYLTAFFNSKLFKFCFKDSFPELLGGTRELSKVFFQKIPVKQISKSEETPFEEKVTQIISLKKQNPDADTSALEAEIDQLVYQLYGLTDEEIAIVEGSV